MASGRLKAQNIAEAQVRRKAQNVAEIKKDAQNQEGDNPVASKKKAIELGAMRISGDTDEANLKLPAVADRLKQSRFAKVGLPILAAGFALQIVATWLR